MIKKQRTYQQQEKLLPQLVNTIIFLEIHSTDSSMQLNLCAPFGVSYSNTHAQSSAEEACGGFVDLRLC